MNARSVVVGIALTFVLGASSAWAQFGTVRGKVVDGEGKPLPDAIVTLELQGGEMQKKLSTKSGKKGDFTQVGLPRGQYTITITKEGFAPATASSTVATGETTELGDFKMIPAAQAAAAAKPQASELNAAVELFHAKKFDEAEAAFKAFLTKNPSSAMGHYDLGCVYVEKQDWVNAEASFKKAIELEPTMKEPYGALVNALQKAGKGAEAQEFLAKTAAAQPDNGMVQYNLAVTYINAQKNTEAYAALEKAAAAMPDNPEIHYLMGTTALNLNNIPGTIKHLEKYLAMSPSNPTNVETAKGLIAALKPAAK